MNISIIIPAKDEEKRLSKFLREVISYCQSSSNYYEIIVVDDRSGDKTARVARDFQKDYGDLKVVKLKVNRGKGYAVKRGLFKAQGDIVLFLDADGSTSPDEIEKNLHYFDEGYDIIVGSRVIGNQENKVKARWHRKLMGRVFNFFVRTFLFKGIEDTQCGFKMFRKEVVQPIFSKILIKRFGFDMEILYLAVKMGLKIKEVPVSWKHVAGSKVNVFSDSLKMFLNILQIRRWHG